MDRVGVAIDFAKSAPDGSFVRGWAYVAKHNGEPVVDWSGQVTPMSVLRNAAHDFVSNARIAKVLHKGKPVGEVVEAVVVDDEFCKALGATTPNRGLWIGMKVSDADIKKRVRSGELKMFSVGGRGGVIDLEEGDSLTEMLDGDQ